MAPFLAEQFPPMTNVLFPAGLVGSSQPLDGVDLTVSRHNSRPVRQKRILKGLSVANPGNFVKFIHLFFAGHKSKDSTATVAVKDYF